jgi:hypothetical protein
VIRCSAIMGKWGIEGLRCPSCQARIVTSKAIFYDNFRCVHCGKSMRVPARYGRTLVLISIVLGFVAVWLSGVRDVMRFCLFWVPAAFGVLTLLVRVAPHLMPPTLTIGGNSQTTTLDLRNVEDDEDDGS